MGVYGAIAEFIHKHSVVTDGGDIPLVAPPSVPDYFEGLLWTRGTLLLRKPVPAILAFISHFRISAVL